MKNKTILFLLLPILLTGCSGDGYSKNGYEFPEVPADKVCVNYVYNFSKQEVNLNSGLYASGNSLLFKQDIIEKGSKLTKPDLNPVRKNYEFAGWHKKESAESLFDFTNEVVNKNLYLYAHWTIVKEETFVEPEYVVPSKIDDSISKAIEVKGILNMPIVNNSVNLTTAGMAKVLKNAANLNDLLDYKMKTGTTFTSSYDKNTRTVSVSATGNDQSKVDVNFTLNNITTSLAITSSSYYEQKAVNYEAKAFDEEAYHIMLAGSSSIENWTTSTEDLAPMVSYNHGIGGTSADEWRTSLNQRLVYPYSPKIIVYYVGVNDIINRSKNGSQTKDDLLAMFDDVHEHLPNTKILYILINSLPGYAHKQAEFDISNNAVKEYAQSHDFIEAINPGSLLMKNSGKPNSAFFLTDGLHMSLYGYVLWGGYVRNKLIEVLSK